MTRLHEDPPARWKLVSTAALPPEAVRRFVPADVDVDVVVVEPRTEEAAAAAVADADIVVGDYLFEIPLSRAVIERMERCRFIQQPSAGYQQIDVAAAAERGIAVSNVGGANDVAVAEHTVMAAVALMRELPVIDREVRRGEWPQLTRPHFELAGKTWGIVGFGRIGRQVARRLAGWDVELLYHDAFRPGADVEESLGVTYAELDDLLARADVVSLHVPLLDTTRRLLGADRLAVLKQSAYLINVSRGEVIDEGALVEVLREGRIAGAALDVFETEPLPAGHPLTELDNVILTPHAAGTVMEARIRLMKLTAANIARVMHGEAPFDVVNGIV
jgi:phosphoglycerate dehydrogenase-like enzyme